MEQNPSATPAPLIPGRLKLAGARLFTPAILARLLDWAFGFFVILLLIAPALRTGPFTWWPIWESADLGGRPAAVGVLSLFPLLVTALWLISRRLSPVRARWTWGRAGLSWPLLGLSLLALGSLDPAPTWRTLVLLGAIGLTWLVYLFVLNERARLLLPFSVVIVIQASVAVGQFLLQRDLGLSALGEPALDPTVTGVSVLLADAHPWLRAYGLTAHPNVLGAMLAILLLMLLPELRAARGRKRFALVLVVSIGLMGLLVSFSRAAWLAFALGVLVQFARIRMARVTPSRVIAFAPLLLVPLFFGVYRDLVLSRFLNLDTLIEFRSLSERWQGIEYAFQIIAAHPWRGVGAGNFSAAVSLFNPEGATVHNVPLLVTAELGVLGAALWLWLTLTPFAQWWQRRNITLIQISLWLAVLVLSLFDVTVWFTTSWRAAVLFGLALAYVAGSRDHPGSLHHSP